MDKPSSRITPEVISQLPQCDISSSNEVKWKRRGKEYYNIYNETKEVAAFRDLIGGDPKNVLFFILKLYYDSKILDPSTKNMYDCICSLITTIEYNTDVVKTEEFVAKMDALFDFIKEYETE
jgi:hypothetical protein